MLSLIERAQSSPSAVVLNKIAASFGVPLAVFFADPGADAGPISRAEERQSWCDPQTGYLREVLSPLGAPAPFQLVQVTLPRGATVHYEGVNRARPYRQQIWVLQGRIEVSFGTERYRLQTGDCLAHDVDGQAHSFSNPLKSSARYVVVTALA